MSEFVINFSLVKNNNKTRPKLNSAKNALNSLPYLNRPVYRANKST
jgi:hypothetical protein